MVRFICKKLFINLNKRYAYYNPHVVVVRKLEKKGNHALKHFYIYLKKKTVIYYQCNVTKKTATLVGFRDTLFGESKLWNKK